MLVFSTHTFTEGDVAVGVGVGMAAISTHAPTEGDGTFPLLYVSVIHFNSRLHGRRRYGVASDTVMVFISTHASTEGDCKFK